MNAVQYFTLKKARKAGKRDGKTWRWRLGWPPWEKKEPYPEPNAQRPSESERQLYMATQNSLQLLAQKWAEEDISMKSLCVKTSKEYQNLLVNLDSEYEKLQTAENKYETAKKGTSR